MIIELLCNAFILFDKHGIKMLNVQITITALSYCWLRNAVEHIQELK